MPTPNRNVAVVTIGYNVYGNRCEISIPMAPPDVDDTDWAVDTCKLLVDQFEEKIMEPLLVFQSKYLACTSIRARPLTAGRAPGYLREYELNQKPGGYNLQATGNQVAALVTFFGEEPPTTEDGSIRFAFNRIPGIPEAHWEENRLIDANGSTAIATIMTKLIDESIDLTGGQPFVRVIRNGIDAEADLEYARTFIVRDYPATLRQRNKPV